MERLGKLNSLPQVTENFIGDVDSLETLLGFDEFEYLALFLWLAIAGPGILSLDHLLQRIFGRPVRGPASAARGP
jgi:hypothetical protein